MSVFRKEQNQVHSMQGNHIVGVATPTTGAQQVEMWHGRMDANSATPPHSHTTEAVVVFLTGSGRQRWRSKRACGAPSRYAGRQHRVGVLAGR